MAGNKSAIDDAKLDRIVAQALRDAEQRDKGYRERALKMYP
ncbi:MAG: HNH endonuclease, partial [Lysobacterales bacterium CG_4_10_14_3_um_filter_64_11]